MITLNFYIETKPKTVLQDQPIYLHVTRLVKNKLYRINTRERVNPKHWNPKTQRAKASSAGAFELNERLDGIKKHITELYRNMVNDNTAITPDEFITAVKNYFDPQPDKSLFDYIDTYIQTQRTQIKPQTIKKFQVLKSHLQRFEIKIRKPISFFSIDVLFIEKFLQYLIEDRGLINNSAHKLIGIFKIFLNWATDRNLNTKLDYKRFRRKKSMAETEIIHLTREELELMFGADLSGNKKLSNVRDTFCFACFTGARYSDVSQIKAEDIKGDAWYCRTIKTETLIEIPLNDYALEILDRHKGERKPLPSISNQKMNVYIKELCKILGFDEPIKTVRYRGAERIETTKPKYENIGTHTARRTFVTLSLEQGMRPETLMKITGHTDFKMLKKYINLTDKVKKSEMKKAWFREPRLKVYNNEL
ncbi:MAG: site-specific integrase [Ignavibacteriaceae bacterium]|nr:site-specific integrase [Ignavibacteriaceae bacterium]